MHTIQKQEINKILEFLYFHNNFTNKITMKIISFYNRTIITLSHHQLHRIVYNKQEIQSITQ